MQGLGLIGGNGLYAQCMYAVRNKASKCLINRAMTDYLRFAAKLRADHGDSEMSAARIASMACMQRAVILDIELSRFKHR